MWHKVAIASAALLGAGVFFVSYRAPFFERRASASTVTVAPRDLAAHDVLDRTPRPAGDSADADGDGIDDDEELRLAKSYFPYFSVDPDDSCARHGVLFRLTPHPADPSKIAIWYTVLWENDCGLHGIGAHVGDDEVFGEIIDPSRPAPGGILAVVAISHQNTACERKTSCGTLPGCSPCTTAVRDGKPYPVVFSSIDKHGNYASESACDRWLCDLAGCSLSEHPDVPDFTNAGEPGKPLTRNLSERGFITKENGWTEQSLMNFDPFSGKKFGRAGNVTDDLSDDAFLISPSGCSGG